MPALESSEPVFMKVLDANGKGVDARTAAYGQTVEFVTTAKLKASTSSALFEYTLPDACIMPLEGYSSKPLDYARHFELSKDNIQLLLDGVPYEGESVITITSDDPESDEGHGYYGHSEYGQHVSSLELGNINLASDAELSIVLPAELVGGVSCGGYGNTVKLDAEVSDDEGGKSYQDANVVYTGTFILQSIDSEGSALPDAGFTLEKEGEDDLRVAATQGLSLHDVPDSIITGSSNHELRTIGHVAAESSGDELQMVDSQTASLSYAGVDEGAYLLHEDAIPSTWRPREHPEPMVLELTANVPNTIVSGKGFCRWSVKLNGEQLPELLRYQDGLLDPTLPSSAFKDSTIVLKAWHVNNNLTAQVEWDDEGLESERPSKTSLQLLENGNKRGEAIQVSEAGNWSHTWEALGSAQSTWTVEEAFDGLVKSADGSSTAQDAQGFDSSSTLQASGLTEKEAAPANAAGATSDESEGAAKMLTAQADSSRTREYTAKYSDIAYDTHEGTATLTVTNTPRLFVDFDSAGGSAVASQTADKGATATAPADPVREGYTFKGWFLDGTELDFSSPISSDMKLVAQWEAKDAKDDPGAKQVPDSDDDDTPTPGNQKPTDDPTEPEEDPEDPTTTPIEPEEGPEDTKATPTEPEKDAEGPAGPEEDHEGPTATPTEPQEDSDDPAKDLSEDPAEPEEEPETPDAGNGDNSDGKVVEKTDDKEAPSADKASTAQTGTSTTRSSTKSTLPTTADPLLPQIALFTIIAGAAIAPLLRAKQKRKSLRQ